MRTKTAITAIIILLISALVSCGSATRDSFTLFSMDTFLDITLWNPKNAEESKTACETGSSGKTPSRSGAAQAAGSR